MTVFNLHVTIHCVLQHYRSSITFTIEKENKGKLPFLDILIDRNIQRPSITFTIVKENNGKLPFLDILIDRNNDKITTSVYRKPTHTGQYLHYTSNYPKSTKQAIVTNLQNRANVICTNEDDLHKEYQQIASTLSANGYPQNILTKKHRKTDNHTAQEKPIGSAIISYAPNISEKLRRIGNTYGIRTAFRSCTTTLRSILTKTKPPNQTQDSKNCIYNIPCECGKRYIGETCRHLQTRVN